jgi:hypothetical protein
VSPLIPQSRHRASQAEGLLWADFVAKRFCSSEHARLIQDQAPRRNVDSKIHSPRFDCCQFQFYSFSAATFATKSAKIRPEQVQQHSVQKSEPLTTT